MSEEKSVLSINTDTVDDLVALIVRTKQSLTEAGETLLAERCHVVVTDDGRVAMRFEDISAGGGHPVVEKALSLDPVYQHGKL